MKKCTLWYYLELESPTPKKWHSKTSSTYCLYKWVYTYRFRLISKSYLTTDKWQTLENTCTHTHTHSVQNLWKRAEVKCGGVYEEEPSFQFCPSKLFSFGEFFLCPSDEHQSWITWKDDPFYSAWETDDRCQLRRTGLVCNTHTHTHTHTVYVQTNHGCRHQPCTHEHKSEAVRTFIREVSSLIERSNIAKGRGTVFARIIQTKLVHLHSNFALISSF